MSTPELMNQKDYAEYCGVGKSAVSNWKKRGQLVLRDGKVDVAASDAKRAREIDPLQGRPTAKESPEPNPAAPAPSPQDDLVDRAEKAELASSAPVANGTVASERALHLKEQRINTALKNAELAGTLVPIEAMTAKVENWVTGYRERMTAALRALDERLALETDRRVVRAVLEQTVHDVSLDFAKQIEGAASEED